jgi:hypothetical protein
MSTIERRPREAVGKLGANSSMSYYEEEAIGTEATAPRDSRSRMAPLSKFSLSEIPTVGPSA